MALFGSIQASGTGNGTPSSTTNAFNGVLVLNTGSVALSTSTQQIALQPIANYYGLPESRMNIQIVAIDTSGTTTAPATVKGTSTAVYEYQLFGKSGTLLLDLKGADNDFINVPHLLNPYGYYQAEVTGTESTTATVVTNTFSTVVGLSIDAAEFPLTPVVTLNTLASRASTLYGLTSNVQMQVWMDFEAHTFARAKLRSYLITGVTTGVFPLQAQLDKNVNMLAHGYYVTADANLSTSNTFNFANNGVQLINQTVYLNFIQKENSIYPSNAHIAGYFPLSIAYPQPFNSNFSTVLQFNIVTAPTIGGVTSVIKAHLLEAY